MQLQFRIRKHIIRREICVEVHNEYNRLVAVIYPQDYGLRIISKYLGDPEITRGAEVPDLRVPLNVPDIKVV
jgi:hypothetical protein